MALKFSDVARRDIVLNSIALPAIEPTRNDAVLETGRVSQPWLSHWDYMLGAPLYRRLPTGRRSRWKIEYGLYGSLRDVGLPPCLRRDVGAARVRSGRSACIGVTALSSGDSPTRDGVDGAIESKGADPGVLFAVTGVNFVFGVVAVGLTSSFCSL